jgi:hypothetical protein
MRPFNREFELIPRSAWRGAEELLAAFFYFSQGRGDYLDYLPHYLWRGSARAGRPGSFSLSMIEMPPDEGKSGPRRRKSP